jgi:hypothetical protein
MLFTAPSPTSTTLASYLTYHALVVPQHHCGLQLVTEHAELVPTVHGVNTREDEVSFPAAEVSFLCGLRRKDEAKALLAFLRKTHENIKFNSSVTPSAARSPNFMGYASNFTAAQMSGKNSRISGLG